MIRLCKFILLLFLALAMIHPVNASTAHQHFYRNIWSPTYHVQRLSYCSVDGKECGLAVATQYCKALGYEKADREIEEHNIGLSNYLMSSGQCRGWTCNGFQLIRCVGTLSHNPPKNYFYRSLRFPYPRYDHFRVDWCYKDGKECGKRAADSFCRRMGYLHAQRYKFQKHVAATKALGNFELCFGNTCKGFKEITCYR